MSVDVHVYVHVHVWQPAVVVNTCTCTCLNPQGSTRTSVMFSIERFYIAFVSSLFSWYSTKYHHIAVIVL